MIASERFIWFLGLRVAWDWPGVLIFGARRIEELDRFSDNLGHPAFLTALALIAAGSVPAPDEYPPAAAEEVATRLGQSVERDDEVGFHVLLCLFVAILPLLVYKNTKACSCCPVRLAVFGVRVGRQTADEFCCVIVTTHCSISFQNESCASALLLPVSPVRCRCPNAPPVYSMRAFKAGQFTLSARADRLFE